jgi:hypothetical protein
MAISKVLNADNGITISYHRAISLAVDLVGNTAQVTVNSHASEQAALDKLPIAWQWRVDVPVGQLAGDEPTLLDEVEAALVSLDTSPFYGGERVTDLGDNLDSAKARAWNRIKLARAAAESKDVIYDGGAYQADKERISGATQLAWMAKQTGQEYLVTWTLSDNTTRTLDADGMIGLGIALGMHVTQVYDTGRALRAQIAAAATIDEVDAIGWPA